VAGVPVAGDVLPATGSPFTMEILVNTHVLYVFINKLYILVKGSFILVCKLLQCLVILDGASWGQPNPVPTTSPARLVAHVTSALSPECGVCCFPFGVLSHHPPSAVRKREGASHGPQHLHWPGDWAR
jgi:hypothetical protein